MPRRNARTSPAALIAVGLVLLLAACAAAPERAQDPAVPDLPAGTWTRVTPTGDTTCADGSEFAFFVRPGVENRLVVDFMGGGACWDRETCSRPFGAEGGGERFYVESLAGAESLLDDASDRVGIYDRDEEANPFARWHHVFVPYCTGDLHLGDATVDYGGGVVVHHAGARNARAALAWVEERYEAPENVFVTGCSAGAYASIFWTPSVRAAFPDARTAQLGDSGAGVITESFAREGLAGWDVAASLPDFVPGVVAATDLQEADVLERMYRAVAAAHPEVPLSQYVSAFDGVQAFFYATMRGVPPDRELLLEWAARARVSLDALEITIPTFDSYLTDAGFTSAEGTPHCIVTRDLLYSLEESGTSFLAWLGTLARGEAPGAVRPVVP